MNHKFERQPGLQGVYDIVTCRACGDSRRVAPEHIVFGIYLPEGNVSSSFSDDCPSSLVQDVPSDFFPAYTALDSIYKRSHQLRDFIPQCPVGHWPKIAIGRWGTPKIILWDSWQIALSSGAGVFNPCYVAIEKGEVIVAWVLPNGDSQQRADVHGWERYASLAHVLYDIPAPNNPDRRYKWFGADYKTDFQALLQCSIAAATDGED